MAGFAPGELVIIAIIAVLAPLQIWALVDVAFIHTFRTEAQRSRWMRIVMIGAVGPIVYLAKRKTL
jgi:hypothetical protein